MTHDTLLRYYNTVDSELLENIEEMILRHLYQGVDHDQLYTIYY